MSTLVRVCYCDINIVIFLASINSIWPDLCLMVKHFQLAELGLHSPVLAQMIMFRKICN